MDAQGQLEKGSCIRHTEGKQKLNIYIGKLVGIQLLKINGKSNTKHILR